MRKRPMPFQSKARTPATSRALLTNRWQYEKENKMKRSPAMRIRMDLAKKTDPADLQSLVKTAQEIEALKDRVCEMGFIFTKPVDARLVTHTFPPEDEELVDPPAEGG